LHVGPGVNDYHCIYPVEPSIQVPLTGRGGLGDLYSEFLGRSNFPYAVLRMPFSVLMKFIAGYAIRDTENLNGQEIRGVLMIPY
jgi:hypothetical protein